MLALEVPRIRGGLGARDLPPHLNFSDHRPALAVALALIGHDDLAASIPRAPEILVAAAEELERRGLHARAVATARRAWATVCATNDAVAAVGVAHRVLTLDRDGPTAEVLDAASTLARSANLPGIRLQALTACADLARFAGRFDHARALATQIEPQIELLDDPTSRAAAWLALASVHIDIGQTDEGVRLIQRALDADGSATKTSRTLARAMALLARTDSPGPLPDQIEQLIRATPDSRTRTELTLDFARALVALGEIRRARSVVATACRIGPWPLLVDMVLTLDPTAAERVFGHKRAGTV
jgi:tetratricopeptide (TPR) repeat protein